MSVEIFDDRICVIGESPYFDDRTDQVHWVDIMAGRVLWRSVTDPKVAGHFDVNAHLGAVVPTTGDEVVLCLPDALVLRAPTGRLRPLATYPAAADPGTPDQATGPALRSNDAKADRAGRLWHGTMAYDRTPGASALYQLSPGADAAAAPVTSAKVIDAVTISNGLGWSPDGRTMYYADSPTGRVDAFEVDPRTGALSNSRPFITVPPGQGDPDGLCVDADGGVWVAYWAGGAVRRFTPTGALDRTVALPTNLVTSCAFAGPQLDLLIITTATDGRAGDAAAGRTYAVRPGGVVGLPVDRYRTRTPR